jgi:hypothetical protein
LAQVTAVEEWQLDIGRKEGLLHDEDSLDIGNVRAVGEPDEGDNQYP